MLICLTITFFSISAQSASQETDSEKLMAAGNDAFRSGDFTAALESYETARNGGEQSPLLLFNMGVAYYKLGEHDQANEAFKSAALESELATLAYFNLALNERKIGNYDQAMTWLERARDNAGSEAERRYVKRMLNLFSEEVELSNRRKARSIRTDAALREPEFAWSMSVMFGYDDNAFRSPDSSYNDLSQSGAPLVNPDTQSGFYLPIVLRGEYAYPVGKTSNLGGSYQYRGDLYLDSELSNADESAHRFALGYEKLLGKRLSSKRRVGVAIVYQVHEETDFDRDDGLEQLSNGADISDRFDYDSTGVEATLRNRKDQFGYGLDARIQRRDYKNITNIFSYDHDFTLLGGYLNYRFTPQARTELSYTYYVRDYDERRARNELGDALPVNPALKYTYHKIEVAQLQRFSTALLAEFSYSYLKRDDDFVGYNDYDQHQIKLAGSYRFSPQLRGLLRVSWRDLEYPNGFAFNEPAAGKKQYDEFELFLAAEYSLTERLSIWTRIRYQDVGSTDPRGAYDRTRASLGISWQSK
jgi:hypothetical protein